MLLYYINTLALFLCIFLGMRLGFEKLSDTLAGVFIHK